MLIGNKFDSLKKVHVTFDPTGLFIHQPYIIQKKDATYFGVLAAVDEKHIIFNYFNESGRHQLCLTTNDEFDLYELKSSSDPEEIAAWNLMIAMNNLDKEDVPVEPDKVEEPVVDDEPDIKSFYIRDARVHNKYPLFVRDNGDLVINYDFMEKLLYDDNVLISISFGIKGHHSCASHIFKSKDVRIHVGGTTLTGKILDEYRDVITCVEIRAGDWKQLDWAHVVIKNRKDVTNNET